MSNVKSVLSALLVLGLGASVLSQSAFAFGGFGNHDGRQAEVMGRDQQLAREIQSNRGRLGSNYGRLMAKDQRIMRQAQRDARMNGGRLTPQEQLKLNREENRLSQQIRRDIR